MIIRMNSLRPFLMGLTTVLSLNLILISASAWGQESSDLTTFKSAPTGTVINQFAKNSMNLCIPALDQAYPNGIKISNLHQPWMDGDTVNTQRIPYVKGNVSNGASVFNTTLTDQTRHFRGNGIPTHNTGIFPVVPRTQAYNIYHGALGDNAEHPTADLIPIEPYDLDITVNRNPVYSSTPYCMESLVVGVATQTHAVWHANIANTDGADNHWVDPIAALPIDQCWGHPYNKEYHYHGYSWRCFPNQGNENEHSPLMGYAMDGFGIFGPRGEQGVMVTNADLDECHGHFGLIEWDGAMIYMYHYHLNNEYPYGPGCFRSQQTYYDAISDAHTHVPMRPLVYGPNQKALAH